MKRLLSALLTLAMCIPAAAGAQSGATPSTATFAPLHSVCIRQTDGTCAAVSATNPLPVTGGGGGGGGGGTTATSTAAAPTYTEGSTTAPLSLNLSGDLRTTAKAQGTVVSGDQSYTVGTVQPFNLTPSGRLKVGLSSAGNIDAATQLTTTTTADLFGCKNRASNTMSAGQTAAIACDTSGQVLVGSASLGAPTDAAWTSGSGSIIALLKTLNGYGADTTTPSAVKIDQTTPGTTNGVVVNSSALPTGAATATLQGTANTTLAAISGQLPASLGPKTPALSIATTNPKSASNGHTTLTSTTTPTQALASNAARNGCTITNASTSVMVVQLGALAGYTLSATVFDGYVAGSVSGVPGYYTCPSDWTGVVNVAWVSANGSAQISERTN